MKATLFDDQTAQTKREGEFNLSWITDPGSHKALTAADKGHLPWIKLAVFGENRTPKKSLRSNANVLAVTGIEVDYDAGEWGIEEAAKAFRRLGVTAYLYTSASHTPAHPKWRALLPFSQPYVGDQADMKQYREYGIDFLEAGTAIAFDNVSRTLSQSYYFGQVEGAAYESRSVNGAASGYIDEVVPQMVMARQEARPSVERALFDMRQGGAYHTNIKYLAGYYINKGMTPDQALLTIQTHMDAIPENLRRDEWETRYTVSVPELVDWAWDQHRTNHPQEAAVALAASGGIKPIDFTAQATARPRLYGDMILRGYLSMLSSMGGVGKSGFTLAMACGVAVGEDLLNVSSRPLSPRKTLLVNNEDDANELRLRAQALTQHYKLDPVQVQQNLVIHSGINLEDRVKVSNKEDAQRGPWADKLIEECKAHQIEILILDPFVSLHESEENSNTAQDQVIAILKDIAVKADVGVLLVHHSRKGGDSRDADSSSRGATAIVAGVRASFGLGTMSETEAEALELPEDDDRARYFGLVSGKLNYAPRASDIDWFKNESVDVWVPDPETGELGNESVGVAVAVSLEPVPPISEETLNLIPALHTRFGERVFTHTGQDFQALRQVMGATALNTVKNRLGDIFPMFDEPPLPVTLGGNTYTLSTEPSGRTVGYKINCQIDLTVIDSQQGVDS